MSEPVSPLMESASRATVLVCDDERPIRDLIRAVLEVEGYEIAEARDGDEAVELTDSLRPDLMILDVMMPGRTGLQVLEHVRADPTLAATRVLMLTARVQTSDKDGAADAGADEYLAKPFSLADLTATVSGLLDGSRP